LTEQESLKIVSFGVLHATRRVSMVDVTLVKLEILGLESGFVDGHFQTAIEFFATLLGAVGDEGRDRQSGGFTGLTTAAMWAINEVASTPKTTGGYRVVNALLAVSAGIYHQVAGISIGEISTLVFDGLQNPD
jgi:hypothetical protein